MCGGSVNAHAWEDAQEGVPYAIGQVSHVGVSRHGVLYAEGKGYDDDRVVMCAACIRRARKVTLTNVPDDLRRQFGLERTATVTFVPGAQLGNGEQSIDYLKLADKREVALYVFADYRDLRLELPVTLRATTMRQAGTSVTPARDLISEPA